MNVKQTKHTVNNPANRVLTPSSTRLTVSEAARRLGVSRTHLSLVLHHHRASRRLTDRYQELKRQHALTAK